MSPRTPSLLRKALPLAGLASLAGLALAGVSLAGASREEGGAEARVPRTSRAAPARSRASLSIALEPRRVHCRSLITVAVEGPETEDGPPPDVEVRWTATGGELLYDDLPEVHWRAPATPGPHHLEVEVSRGEASRRARRRVVVREPSTAGMVRIPTGEFLCGDVRGTRDVDEVKTVQNRNDEPFHRVHLGGYWIDRYPVTHGQFAAFLREAFEQGMLEVGPVAVYGEHEGSRVPFYYLGRYDELIIDYYETRPARRTGFLHAIRFAGGRFEVQSGREDHPVVDVTWFGAQAYANFHGKRLPTSAQWEKAGRGTDGRRFPWGNRRPTRYHVNLEGEFTPVGTYSPTGDSPYGVADMVSPAFEWTRDWFNASYYEDFHAWTPHEDPAGTFWGTSHTIRGFPGVAAMPPYDIRQPLTRNYNWMFEFLTGDAFGNIETTFRTVLEPAAGDGEVPDAAATDTTARDAPGLDR